MTDKEFVVDADRERGRLHALAVLVGCIVGVAAFWLFVSERGDFVAGEFALGKSMTSAIARYPDDSGEQVSGHYRDLELIARSIDAAPENREKVLLLGASQLHTIVDMNPDDHLAVWWANRAADTAGIPVSFWQLSDGNASLHEFLGLYLLLREKGQLPDRIVVGLMYDDLMEPGLRPSLARQLAAARDSIGSAGNLDGVEQLFSLLPARPEEANSAATSVQSTEDGVTANASTSARRTPQEILDNLLTGALEAAWPVYALRHNARASLIADGKNFVIGQLVRATGGRPVVRIPPEQAEWQLRALDALRILANGDGVSLTLYIPPHRPGMQRFYYERADYDEFKQRMAAYAAKHGLQFADFETLIDGNRYGFTRLGFEDVFHFDGAAHARFGEALAGLFTAGGN